MRIDHVVQRESPVDQRLEAVCGQLPESVECLLRMGPDADDRELGEGGGAARRPRGRLFIRDGIGNAAPHLRRHRNQLGVRARTMDADELCTGASVVAPRLARGALATGDERRDRDPVAGLQTANTLPHLDHVAREVGPKDVRKCELRERVAARACANVEQTAHADCVDTHQHLTCGRLGRGGVLDLQDIRRAELVDDSCFHDVSTTTWLVSRPKSATSISTISPGLRNSPRGRPTPSGVPVAITSPGSNVTRSLAAAIRAATPTTMSDVFASCLSWPFTHRRSSKSCGFSTRNAGPKPGPTGVDWSAPLDGSQSH